MIYQIGFFRKLTKHHVKDIPFIHAFNFSFFSRIILIAILTGFSVVSSAQIAGDWRSKPKTMTWSSFNSWERYNGTSWVSSVYTPGFTSTLSAKNNTVTISAGSIVIYDISYTNPIKNLVIDGEFQLLVHSFSFPIFSIANDVVVNAGGTFTSVFSSGQMQLFTFKVGGNVSVNGTINLLDSTRLDMNGSGSQQISGSGSYAISVNDLTHSGTGDLTISAGLTAKRAIISSSSDSMLFMSPVTFSGPANSITGTNGSLSFQNMLIKAPITASCGIAITGDVTLSDGGSFSSTNTTTLAGLSNQMISGSGSYAISLSDLTHSGASKVTVSGSVTSTGTISNPSTSSMEFTSPVTFSGSTNSITGTDGSLSFQDIVINAPTTASCGITIKGNVALADSSSFTSTSTTTLAGGLNQTVSGSGSSFILTKDLIHSAGSNATISASLTSTGTISNPSGGLSFTSPVTFSGATNSITGAVGSISFQDMLITNPTTASINITINGDITFSPTGSFSSSKTCTFAGSSDQTINASGASSTFYDLIIAKSAGTNITLAGTGTITVSNTLNLTRGNLISSPTHGLSLTSGRSMGGSASSFIDGSVSVLINNGATLTLPLGSTSANRYRPLVLSHTTANDTWNVLYRGYDPIYDGYPNNSKSSSLGTVSTNEYWLISPSLSSTYADVTFSYGVGSYASSDIGNVASLRVGHWTGTQWDLPVTGSGSTVVQSGTNITGTIKVTKVQSFSPFTVASVDLSSPLPVGLLYFVGNANEDKVTLEWKTSSEVNNDFFSIDHSTNGTDFKTIGTVKGHGTSPMASSYSLQDNEPTVGPNYYRLYQTDFDGRSTYLNDIEVTVSKTTARTTVFPNPIYRGQLLNAEVDDLQANSKLIMTIYDSKGTQHWTGVVEVNSEGQIKIQYSTKEFAPGLYFLRVGNYTVKFIVY